MTGPKILVSRPKETAPGQAPPPGSFNIQQGAKSKSRSRQPNADAARLKVVVRRLPPGLTLAEFEKHIGKEWHLNSGKVDYMSYKSGKVQKDVTAQSRPSRAVLHLTHDSHLLTLVNHVKDTTFTDAKGTINLSTYVGPPTVEFAPFQRIPKTPRPDARQGLIDQDDEFIAFLEELTNPDAARVPLELSEKQERVSITPLVQYLKDKKNSKLKDGKGRLGKERKERSERKERKPVLLAKKDGSKAESTKSPRTKPAETAEPKRRERAPMLNAAQILQRDLGLQGGSARNRRPRKKEAEGETAQETPEAGAALPESEAPKEVKTPASPRPPKKARPATKPAGMEAGASDKPESTAAGFVKHVDQSKGVTDEALRASLGQFGTITSLKVEIAKGHAFVDFADEQSLQKAIAAGSIPTGDGKVSVELRRSRDELKRGSRPRPKASKKPENSDKKPERARGRGRGKAREQA